MYMAYHGLTQLLGKAKFVNREYGMVMYRGECKLHDNVLPSLFRGRSNIAGAVAPLNKIKNRVVKDEQLCNFIKLSSTPKAPTRGSFTVGRSRQTCLTRCYCIYCVVPQATLHIVLHSSWNKIK